MMTDAHEDGSAAGRKGKAERGENRNSREDVGGQRRRTEVRAELRQSGLQLATYELRVRKMADFSGWKVLFLKWTQQAEQQD